MHAEIRFTVSLTVFLAWTLLTIWIRRQRPESNWPVLYWAAILAVAIYWDRETWDPRWIAAGLAAALLLRFEFMNRAVERAVGTVEYLVLGYVLVQGVRLLVT